MDSLDPHQELIELLMDGARYGDLEDVDSALAQHVGVDSKDEEDRTALHMACANGHADVALRLLNAGADTDVKNKEGNTPLHWACLNGHKEVVRILLEKQAVASILNNVGRTPVDEALTKDFKEIMEVINSFNGGAVDVEEVADGDEDMGVDDTIGEEAGEGVEGEEENEEEEVRKPSENGVGR